MSDIRSQAAMYRSNTRRKRQERLGVTLLALAVVFSTFSALILPAFTAEKPEKCRYEEHIHTADCYERVLVCEKPEVPAHHHDESCLLHERVPVCGLEETQGHAHTDACYKDRDTLICGLRETEGHTHGDDCYEVRLICPLTEHVHSLACYADPYADLETEEQYKLSFPVCPEDTPRLVRLMKIARSQLGYHESVLNYVVDENGTAKGITRYGTWYGEPYDDWDAMFVSFCLHYAGIEQDVFPYESSAYRWIELLRLQGYYTEASDGYIPLPGDLIFLYDENEQVGSVGLVDYVDRENSIVSTIEGNLKDGVEQGRHVMSGVPLPDDTCRIVGYGVLPESLREEAGGLEGDEPDGEAPAEGENATGEDEGAVNGERKIFTTETGKEEVIVPAAGAGTVVDTGTEDGKETGSEGSEETKTEDGERKIFTTETGKEEVILPAAGTDTVGDAGTEDGEDAGTEDGEKAGTEDSEEAGTEDGEETETEDGEEANVAEAPAVELPVETLTAVCGSYSIAVELGVPEGQTWSLAVSELAPTEEQIAAVEDSLSTVFPNGAVRQAHVYPDDLLLLDIGILDEENNEIEPEGAVRVSVDKIVEAPKSGMNLTASRLIITPSIVHFGADGAENLQASTHGDGFSFTTESFSVYAIAYTVSFEYEVDGVVFTTTVPGAKDIELYDIIEGLGFVAERETADYVSRIESVAGTNEEVVRVNAGDGWTVRVLKDGDAQLVITMTDGAEFSIDVKAEGVTSVTDETETAVLSTVNDFYLPETAVVTAAAVEGEEAIAAVENEAGAEEDTAYRVYDISLENVDTAEYEDGFRVNVSLDGTISGRDFRLYHIHDGETTDITETLVLNCEPGENEVQIVSGFTFETDSFSEFVLSYTVDFHYEVNGRTYEFTLPGGGFISFTDLVEVLGIAGGTDNGQNAPDHEAELSEDDRAENSGISEDAGAENTEADAAAEMDNTGAFRAPDDVVVSDAARAFVADVINVEFSSPELVDVSKVEADTTVGQIRESRGLECEYSAELTEEQIEEINAQTVEAGDWALISVQPFTSEETLTVTMKDGERFTVRVTDYQISTNILTADGITFRITVTFDEDAEIPEGTKLEAREIEWGSDEYIQYLGKTWSEVNRVFSESNSRDEDTPEGRYINVNAARFFDIKLVYEGEVIEPKAPVQVEITYVDGLPSWDNTKPGVVHFTQENEIELLEGVETDVEDEAAVSFRYVQDSFSVIGTYIQQETHDAVTPPRGAATSYGMTAGGNAEPEVPAGGGEKKGPEEDPVLTLAPMDLRVSGVAESPSTEDRSGLPLPQGNKTLVPNDDGTYTLTLSVKGSSVSEERIEENKANILFVMDRSSSMITNTVSSEESDYWYYGTWNTNETTFRGDISPANGYQFYGVINGNYVQLNASSTWTSWYNYNLTYWNGNRYVNYPQNSPIYVKSPITRLYAEQDALDQLTERLMAKNSAERPDDIEIRVISFGDQRFDYKSWSNETESGWIQGTSNATFMDKVNSNRYTSGTNWEEALEYAYQVISQKKNQDGADEDYYVVFLTDGEPTAVHGESGKAYHRDDNGEGGGCIVAYEAAKDDAKKLVDQGYRFYNIFTFRQGENDVYSRYLTNYAYGYGNHIGNATPELQQYYSDAQTINELADTFNNIFQTIEDVTGHTNVSITDTLTTDAMTTTVVQGTTNGYVYTVMDPSGTILYSVTATGSVSDPTVTFYVPGSGTKTYTASATAVGDRKLYSITTAEGQEYRIALADKNDTTGRLEWDLSPVGILMNDCTYSVSFVVWPDQAAYDYVAALNNGLPGYTWDDSAAVDSGKGYRTGGVSQYPSIVKYQNGTYAVLTNTDQKVHYSVIEMETINGEPNGDPTVHGPYYSDLQTPDPMELTHTGSSLEKTWNVERDPGILAQLLYEPDGSSAEFAIDFDIMRGSEATPYITITLGWDEEQQRYNWEPGSITTVTYNGNPVEVGTRWSADFAIATGLMLSESHMEARGLDKSAYPSGTWNNTTYYVLEPGHDYTVVERIGEDDAAKIGYEFDFVSPVYHPMLVDGVLRSVNFAASGNSIAITGMTDASVDLQSLKVENTLRGYLHLKKIVINQHNAPVNDDTKFEYTLTLYNSTNPGPFTEEHIPWYGINDLFYHDEDYNYYQAEKTGTTGTLTLRTESGYICTAACDGEFDPNIVGPTTVTFTDEHGTVKTIDLYGNQTTALSENTVEAVMDINRNERLSIANVPAGTVYTITETRKTGYELVGIESSQPSTRNGYTITGTIVANADNDITYTNKTNTGPLEITKNIRTDGVTDPERTGTFYYGVYTAQCTGTDSDPDPIRTGFIDVTINGTETVRESDLPYGTYYVYELTGENGMPIVSGTNGKVRTIGSMVYTVTGSGTTAAVDSETEAPEAVLNNDVKTFEFTKIWKTITDANDDWGGKVIEVTFYRTTGTPKPASDESLGAFTIRRGSDNTLEMAPNDSDNAIAWENTADSVNGYTFRTEGLVKMDDDGSEYTYYVVETQLGGYQEPSYYNKFGQAKTPGSDAAENYAKNGEYIVNRPLESVALPMTGSDGGHAARTGGLLLMAVAALFFAFRRKKELFG